MNTEMIDLETYVLTQLRCHERPIESPVAKGALSGGLCYLSASLLFLFLPNLYSFFTSGGYFFNFPARTLFLISVCGACFGAAVFWILSHSFARLRVTLDGSRTGFYAGFLVGVFLGAGVLISQLVTTYMWQFDLGMTLHASEMNHSAILCGSMCAFVGAILGAILARPSPLPANTPEPRFVDKSGRVRKLILPLSQIEQQRSRGCNERFRFSIGQLFALTTVIALSIAIPQMIHEYMMTIPSLSHVSYLITVHLIAVSLLVLTYLTWVIFRGPQALARLALASTRHRRSRQNVGLGHSANFSRMNRNMRPNTTDNQAVHAEDGVARLRMENQLAVPGDG